MIRDITKLSEFGAIVRRVRDLAQAPFNELHWAPRINSFGWRLAPNPLRAERHDVAISELHTLFDGNDEADESLEPDAQICFAAPEFSFGIAEAFGDALDNSRARSRFSDLFAHVQAQVCGALGEPDHRLHYVLDYLPRMIFGVAVWSFEENDLYLVQDVYEGHAGSGGIVDLRVLRKSKQPAKLPLESVLTHG